MHDYSAFYPITDDILRLVLLHHIRRVYDRTSIDKYAEEIGEKMEAVNDTLAGRGPTRPILDDLNLVEHFESVEERLFVIQTRTKRVYVTKHN